MTTLTSGQLDTLRELRSLWPDRPLVLIGASALACFLEMRWRRTYDLDLAVSIASGEFPGRLLDLDRWERDPNLPQRWIAPRGVRVDVLPIDAQALRERQLEWPDGTIMNLVGVRLVFDNSIALALADDLTFDVASLPVIALLKMVAYQDRPHERENDLADIGFILSEGVDADDDDRYTDPVLSRGLDYDRAGPYLIGRRLGEIVNNEEGEAATRFIQKAMDEEDGHQTHVRLASSGPREWRREPRRMVSCLEAFRDGLFTT